MGMDMEEAVGEGGEGIGDLIGEEWVPDGWTIESVSGDYQGIRASIEFENFDQLRGRMAGLSGMEGVDIPMSTGMLSDISLERDGNVFMFRLAIPEQPEDMFDGMTEDSPMPIDPAMLEDIFDIRFTLTLPGEIVADRTNADLTTGQTLVWNLSLDDDGRGARGPIAAPRQRGGHDHRVGGGSLGAGGRRLRMVRPQTPGGGGLGRGARAARIRGCRRGFLRRRLIPGDRCRRRRRVAAPPVHRGRLGEVALSEYGILKGTPRRGGRS